MAIHFTLLTYKSLTAEPHQAVWMIVGMPGRGDLALCIPMRRQAHAVAFWLDEGLDELNVNRLSCTLNTLMMKSFLIS